MAQFHNLAGVVTNDLVEKIGGGSFAASYINWSRTLQLLRQNAPGWTVETKEAADGGILFQAPVGGYLQLRVLHEDGTAGAWVPQAIMDNRNKAISYDKISARDITDTQRRGACLCLAYSFGLGAELWAKMKLEAGWGQAEEAGEAPKPAPTTTAAPVVAAAAKASEVTEATFREAALEKGVQTVVIDILCGKLNGKWDAGLKTLEKKSADELNEQYMPVSNEESEQW
jgi:hypothetical protein